MTDALQGCSLLFYLFSSLALISGLMVITARNPVYSVLFLILVFFNSAALLLLLGLDFFAMIFLVVYVGAIAVLFLFVVMMLDIRLSEMNEKRLRYLPVGIFLGFLFLCQLVVIFDYNDHPFVIEVATSTPSNNSPRGVGSATALTNAHTALLGDSTGGSSTLEYYLPNVISESQTSASLETNLQLSQTDVRGAFYATQSIVQWLPFLTSLSNIQSIGMLIYTYYSLFFLMASFILLVAMIGAIVLTLHKDVHLKDQKVFLQNTRLFAETVYKVE